MFSSGSACRVELPNEGRRRRMAKVTYFVRMVAKEGKAEEARERLRPLVEGVVPNASPFAVKGYAA